MDLTVYLGIRWAKSFVDLLTHNNLTSRFFIQFMIFSKISKFFQGSLKRPLNSNDYV